MLEQIVSILHEGENEVMMDMDGMMNMDGFNNMMQTGGLFGVPFMFIGGFLLLLVIVISLYALFKLFDNTAQQNSPTIIVTPAGSTTQVAPMPSQSAPQVNTVPVQPQVPTTTACPNCGNPVPPGAHFCPTCGFNLSRRQ